MVAYNFHRRFEAPVVTLTKTGTIRDRGRRRHARPGELLQLYTGQRTRYCRLIATATCLSEARLRVWFPSPRVVIGEIDDTVPIYEVNHCADFDAFARADGFTDWDDMARYWWDQEKCLYFDRRWIRWDPATIRQP